MNGHLDVAYSELTRVLPWSLRALGYKFGTADRGAHLVATAAAMDPSVLDAMARAEPRPEAQPTIRRTADRLEIDASAVSLLEVGPTAVDWLAAHAADGPVACIISGAADAFLLPAVVEGALAYDIACVAAVDGEGIDATWLVATRDNGAGILVRGGGRERLVALLGAESELGRCLEASANGTRGIMLLAGQSFPAIQATSSAIRPDDKLRAAYRDNIPVSQETLDALYGLEMITWAPTSERSRSQAGFTMPAGAPK